MNFLSNKSTSCKRCALAREEMIASQAFWNRIKNAAPDKNEKKPGEAAGVKDAFCSRDRMSPIWLCKIKASFFVGT